MTKFSDATVQRFSAGGARCSAGPASLLQFLQVGCQPARVRRRRARQSRLLRDVSDKEGAPSLSVH